MGINVQAYILNISAIQTIEELQEMAKNNYAHTVESVLTSYQDKVYTAPQWIMRGDVVFFYHAVSANTHNKRLRKEVEKGNFEDEQALIEYLDYCDELYNKYGGKIYAVGRISDNPAYYSDTDWEHPHFKTRIFAPVDNVVKLDFPILSKQFNDFLSIAKQRGITPVLGNDFMKMKSVVLRYNDIPFLKKCQSLSVPLKDVKKGNWLQSANESGRKYLSEAQFRKYYVDYLLMSLADDGKIYEEIDCIRGGKRTGIVDDVILFGGAYLSVEIKLNSKLNTPALMEQLKKYVDVEEFKDVCKDKDLIWGNWVLLIDVFDVCIYEKDEENTLYEVMKLYNIKSMADVRKLKYMIIEED